MSKAEHEAVVSSIPTSVWRLVERILWILDRPMYRHRRAQFEYRGICIQRDADDAKVFIKVPRAPEVSVLLNPDTSGLLKTRHGRKNIRALSAILVKDDVVLNSLLQAL